MKDIGLNYDTHDFDIVNRDSYFKDDLDAVVQNLKIRLWLFLGEWFLDTERGVSYFTDINVKVPDLSLIQSVVKDTIMKTDHILSIEKFELSLDRNTRILSIVFQCQSDFGQTPVLTEGVLL